MPPVIRPPGSVKSEVDLAPDATSLPVTVERKAGRAQAFVLLGAGALAALAIPFVLLLPAGVGRGPFVIIAAIALVAAVALLLGGVHSLVGWVEWTFDAPREGVYLLELRYAAREGRNPAAVTINGRPAGELILWPTGGDSTWAWDRLAVRLRSGENVIRLAPTSRVWIDHLNVLPAGAGI